MKLRRWHRIGIVLSVLWMLLAGYNERSKQVDFAANHAVAMGRLCLEINQKPKESCFEEQDLILMRALKPNWENVAFVAIAPVFLAWLLVFIGRMIFSWVRRGES